MNINNIAEHLAREVVDISKDITAHSKTALTEESEQFIEWVLLKRERVTPREIFTFLERQGVPRKETKPSKTGQPLAKGEMIEVNAEKCKKGHLIDLLKPVHGQVATVQEVEKDDVILKFQNTRLPDLRIDGGVDGPKSGLYRYTPAEAALEGGDRPAKLFEVVYISDENAKPPSADNIKQIEEYIERGKDKGENRSRCYYTGLALGIYTNKEGEDYFKIFSQQRDHYPRAINPSKGKCYYIGLLKRRPNWQDEYQRMISEAAQDNNE